MSAGKGDTPRPVNPKKYGENYDRIFRKQSNTLPYDTYGIAYDPIENHPKATPELIAKAKSLGIETFVTPAFWNSGERIKP